MFVTDSRFDRYQLETICVEAVEGGVDAIQLRAPSMAKRERACLARALQTRLGGRARLLVNSDISLAKELNCGLHLPEAGAHPRDLRGFLSDGVLLGRSVHSECEARNSGGADYVLAGNVFSTLSKPGSSGIGPNGLRLIVAAASAPVLAIGGITKANAAKVIDAGASGVAVIRAISESTNPRAAARSLRDVIDAALAERTVMVKSIEPTPIQVTVNGKTVQLDAQSTVGDFLSSRGLQERILVVELNRESLERSLYATTVLVDGDSIEVVHAIGGG